MEVVFDNKANVLSAKLHTRHDNSIIYTISTEETLWRGRIVTYLRDRNPLSGAHSVVVGAINWKKKTFDIMGTKHSLDNVRRKVGDFGKKFVGE